MIEPSEKATIVRSHILLLWRNSSDRAIARQLESDGLKVSNRTVSAHRKRLEERHDPAAVRKYTPRPVMVG